MLAYHGRMAPCPSRRRSSLPDPWMRPGTVVTAAVDGRPGPALRWGLCVWPPVFPGIWDLSGVRLLPPGTQYNVIISVQFPSNRASEISFKKVFQVPGVLRWIQSSHGRRGFFLCLAASAARGTESFFQSFLHLRP